MFRARRPSVESLEALLERARRADPTYTEVGATQGAPPGAYLHDDADATVGHGRDAFTRAAEALGRWEAQRGAGVAVYPEKARVEVGESVILLIRVGPLWALAPCRVVYVLHEADVYGFAYGTLPGHPEQGEAAFSVALAADGSVSLRVTSFSRRAALLARLGSPLARRLQQRVTRRYFEAIRTATRAP